MNFALGAMRTVGIKGMKLHPALPKRCPPPR